MKEKLVLDAHKDLKDIIIGIEDMKRESDGTINGLKESIKDISNDLYFYKWISGISSMSLGFLTGILFLKK